MALEAMDLPHVLDRLVAASPRSRSAYADLEAALLADSSSEVSVLAAEASALMAPGCQNLQRLIEYSRLFSLSPNAGVDWGLDSALEQAGIALAPVQDDLAGLQVQHPDVRLSDRAHK